MEEKLLNTIREQYSTPIVLHVNLLLLNVTNSLFIRLQVSIQRFPSYRYTCSVLITSVLITSVLITSVLITSVLIHGSFFMYYLCICEIKRVVLQLLIFNIVM